MASRGLSAREVARRSNVAVNTVLGITKGTSTPKLGNLIALAAGLDLTIDQLLGQTAVDHLSRQAEPPQVT